MSGDGCPYCSGHRIILGYNDLFTKFPHLEAEWDYSKNKGKVPQKSSPWYNGKAWWLCHKGHSWNASIKMAELLD